MLDAVYATSAGPFVQTYHIFRIVVANGFEVSEFLNIAQAAGLEPASPWWAIFLLIYASRKTVQFPKGMTFAEMAVLRAIRKKPA